MTYIELYNRAEVLLERNKITLGEYEEMIKPLYREIIPEKDIILLGQDYWYRYFNITEKTWVTEDGEYVDSSFCITRKANDDEDNMKCKKGEKE